MHRRRFSFSAPPITNGAQASWEMANERILTNETTHGKKVGDSVIGKIDNTETIIRMLIAHRKAEAQ